MSERARVWMWVRKMFGDEYCQQAQMNYKQTKATTTEPNRIL